MTQDGAGRTERKAGDYAFSADVLPAGRTPVACGAEAMIARPSGIDATIEEGTS
ncbi:MAG: hypothetical protein LBH48_01945 [Bifidobacteriaceae bacterium]|nr:hypothetical protein [Bifidobacteriaceae bacterium]